MIDDIKVLIGLVCETGDISRFANLESRSIQYQAVFFQAFFFR